MEKVVWYVGTNELDSSLNVLFNGLKKYSNIEYIKGGIDPYKVLKTSAKYIIGSYRYYEGELLNVMRDRFGEGCFCFIHGFNTKGLSNLNTFKQRYQRLYKNKIKLLVSCSYSYKYLKQIGVDGVILRFGVDLDEFNPINKLKKESPVFGMCFQRRKLHRKGADIISKLSDLGYMVKVADAISHTELYKFYNQIDCLLVASDDDGRETFCIPIIEAAACCTPVISTKVGCASEVIINGYNGYIVNSKDDVIAALQEKHNFVELGKNARSIVESMWSWKSVINKWDKVICGV